MRKLLLVCCAMLLLVSPLCYAYSVPSDTIVYVTDSGTKYHRESCSYLKSSRSMTIAQAKASGYEPCSRCNPDRITGEYESTWNGESGNSGQDAGERPSAPSSQNQIHDYEIPSADEKIEPEEILVIAIVLVPFFSVVFLAGSTAKNKEKKAGISHVVNTKRNKTVISASSISIVLFFFFLILSNCKLTGEFSFLYIENQNTGQAMSLGLSIITHLFLWLVLSLIPASCMFLFSMFVYLILHRKDPRLMERGYTPPYESEFYFGVAVSFSSTYIATFILMVLFACGIVVHIPS